MKWYLDLDETLFNTNKFYSETCRAVGRAYDVNPMAFGVRLLRLRQQFPDGSSRGVLRLFHALRSYGIDALEAQALLHSELKHNDFLYKDAHAFLDWLAKRGSKPTILTFGDNETQNFKLSMVPRLAKFNTHIVQIPKQEFLKTKHHAKAILVDDKPVYDLPNWCSGVFLARKASTPKDYKGRVVKTLDELIV